MTRIKVEVAVHPQCVVTAVRFYCNPYVYVEYQTALSDAPFEVYRRINEKADVKELISYVRGATNEAGNLDFKTASTLDGLKGTFILRYNTVATEGGVYSPIEVIEARHILLSSDGQGGGKDLGYAFTPDMLNAVMRNVFTKVKNKDTESLNTIFKALRL